MTSQKVRTNIYLDETIKAQAKELFSKYHISLSDAINMFLSQSVLEQGLPFQVKIPNKETLEAINDVETKNNLQEISFEQLKEDMQQCIAK